MSNKLDDLMPFDGYREKRREVFPSRTSLDWFTRKHKATLIEAGALLLIAGRLVVQPDRYDEVVRAEGQRAVEDHYCRVHNL